MKCPEKMFLITLPRYEIARSLAHRALTSAKLYGWNLTSFHGVEGRTVNNDAAWKRWNIFFDQTDNGFYGYAKQWGARGVFLSHWCLWYDCLRYNEPIGIFEHDVVFHKPPPETVPECDVYKFNKRMAMTPWTVLGSPDNPVPSGKWWEGACGYFITPKGAGKIIDWVHQYGLLPPDVLIAENVVDVKFDNDQRLTEEIGPLSYVDNFPKQGFA